MKRDPESLRILMDKAHFMHMKGYNCSETVAWTLSSYWNLDMNIASATGFGGGIARSAATCGALAGAIIALGCKVGRVDPTDDEKKALCYRLGQAVMDGFAKETGTTLCKDIIGFVLSEPGGPDRYSSGNFKEGKCKDAIERAVKLAIDVVERMETQV